MFNALTKRLMKTFDNMRKRGVIREADLDEALREIRVALLEADVAIDVAKSFVAEVRKQALGQEVIRSITPDQMIVKIVHDRLVEMLDHTSAPSFALRKKPTKILLVGLQGSGKTTSSAKLARFFAHKSMGTALLASVDVHRPAAITQLETLTRSIPQAHFVSADPQEQPLDIAKRALKSLETSGADIFILDTAGRLHTDDTLMEEIEEIAAYVHPEEILLTVDMMTGQDAINVARAFKERLPLTGIILTRADGESRGGVALSMRAETGCPIRFLGTGEHLENLELFEASRIAGRILGQGDIVSLVEHATEIFKKEEGEKAFSALQSGRFTLDDMRDQLKNIHKMGGFSRFVKMLPGGDIMAEMQQKQKMNDHSVVRQLAILSSMTPKERHHYKLLNASRRRRIAAGAGCSVQEVNRLIKSYEGMVDFQKKLKKMSGKRGFEESLLDMFK